MCRAKTFPMARHISRWSSGTSNLRDIKIAWDIKIFFWGRTAGRTYLVDVDAIRSVPQLPHQEVDRAETRDEQKEEVQQVLNHALVANLVETTVLEH